jgi:hypothetical protein
MIFWKMNLTLCDPGIKYIQPFSNVASSNAIQTLIACKVVNDQYGTSRCLLKQNTDNGKKTIYHFYQEVGFANGSLINA